MTEKDTHLKCEVCAENPSIAPHAMASYSVIGGSNSIADFVELTQALRELGIRAQFEDAVANIDCSQYDVPTGQSVTIGTIDVYSDGSFDINLD